MEFIKQKQHNYSYAFRRLYKMIEESTDKEFICKFKEVFSLNDIEYRSLVSDVKSFKKREQEAWEVKQESIDELVESLENEKLTKRERFKALRKISYLSKGIGRESIFGGRKLIQKITYECNKKVRDTEKIKQLTNEFRDKRIIPFMVIGEANQNGNRFFNLSTLTDGIVTYKPFYGKKITIEVKTPKGWEKDLMKIATMAANNELSVSVRLSTKYLYLTYDEEQLNGYAVDEVSRRKDVKEIKSKHHPKEVESGLIKELYKEYYDKQREKKLSNKVTDRCIAIDMNPTDIGFSVLDKNGDNSASIVYCGMIDLGELCKKTGKSPSDAYTKYLNNKRRYEITIAVKKLFDIASHYGCSSFVIEGLKLKDKLNHEVNRKVKNVWHRELLTRCIKRRCNETGIELIEINPCYSSFIGNIQHHYADACNASIEIGRRGLYKYENGGFYPSVTTEDICTLEAKFGDVVKCSTGSNWVNIYKSLQDFFIQKEFSYRLRTRIDEVKEPYKSFSINSYKSNIKIIIFN